ncbi:peptidoglycan-binding protein [Roseospira goensis]|uniref:Putative chitinase n=1 Tax=Roseospira goensis TaxID=391922 RepID=A0A7W6S318_9PROT|nr:peptidoglycan-binding protein [Roseospira goensis]MBB4287831.1 putative chitinase [Roseospira goensis]
MLTESVLYATAGGRFGDRQADIVRAVVAVAPDLLPRFDIHPLRRLAHFLAQICHESDRFKTTREYASGDAYEGRPDLGNTEPGDGRRFAGRGLLQLTGRANYRWAGDLLGLDLVAEPERAADPALSLHIACLYWRDRTLNPLADADDLRAVTRHINGGLNGLVHRARCLARAETALVQQRLADLGHDPGPVDGAEGRRTRAGLAAFQRTAGLDPTGHRSPSTEARLFAGGAPRAAPDTAAPSSAAGRARHIAHLARALADELDASTSPERTIP